MATTFLRPGIMVVLKTSIEGGYTYERKELDADQTVAPEGGEAKRWETTKIVENPAELKAAQDVRGKARKAISKHCAHTSFGLLCPKDDEATLDAAIEEARALTRAHNAQAGNTRVHIYALKGQVASTDEQAARAIGAEMRDLLEQMQRGIDQLDPQAIRDAADRAREMQAMLAPEQAERISAAVDQARKAARAIVARVEKDGEDAAIVLADIQRGSIQRARIAFLDLDDGPAVAKADPMPAVQVQRVAELDVTGTEGGA